MRRLLIAGNWKMNLDRERGIKLALEVAKSVGEAKCDVAVCPPFVYLTSVGEAIRGTAVQLGAQDCYYEKEGAFTGEITAGMLKDCGARYVIIGHSERRHTIGHLEDDRMINLKVRATRAAGLIPIICVGETLGQRDTAQTLDVLTFQLTAGLVGVELKGPEDLVIAYEPVWAIGTGRNATPGQAQEAHAHLRAELLRLSGGVADQIRILYGGSVKPDNAKSLMAQPDVDGGLIGGASLNADSFLGIVREALAAKG